MGHDIHNVRYRWLTTCGEEYCDQSIHGAAVLVLNGQLTMYISKINAQTGNRLYSSNEVDESDAKMAQFTLINTCTTHATVQRLNETFSTLLAEFHLHRQQGYYILQEFT